MSNLIRYIANKLEPITIMDTYEVNGILVDFICFLYKGKDPVYYSFIAGDTYKAICNGLSYISVQGTTEQIIRQRGAEGYWKNNTRIVIRGNYIKLKLLKIIK